MGRKGKLYPFVCALCGNPFSVRRTKQTYCSVECRIKGALPKQVAHANNQFLCHGLRTVKPKFNIDKDGIKSRIVGTM